MLQKGCQFREKDNNTDNQGCNGAGKDGAGADIFHVADPLIFFWLDDVGQSLDSRIDGFGSKYQSNGNENGNPFTRRDPEKPSAQNSQNSHNAMNPGIMLLPDKNDQPSPGVPKTGQSCFKRKLAHCRGVSHKNSKNH